MEQTPRDKLGEFVELTAAFMAAGRVAAISDYPDVKARFAELRDRLESRLFDLAGELVQTIP